MSMATLRHGVAGDRPHLLAVVVPQPAGPRPPASAPEERSATPSDPPKRVDAVLCQASQLLELRGRQGRAAAQGVSLGAGQPKPGVEVAAFAAGC
jgi:hypothetical protein